MKRLFLLPASVLPAPLLAHGGHPPVPEALHGVSHIAPVLGAALVVVVALTALYGRWKS